MHVYSQRDARGVRDARGAVFRDIVLKFIVSIAECRRVCRPVSVSKNWFRHDWSLMVVNFCYFILIQIRGEKVVYVTHQSSI